MLPHICRKQFDVICCWLIFRSIDLIMNYLTLLLVKTEFKVKTQTMTITLATSVG